MTEQAGGDCPILFMVFNRLDEAILVLGQIRKYQPKRLFISADGARPNIAGEAERCETVRKAVLDGIDWACDVKTKFNPVNQGCKLAISSAISWFFENVSQGIILEDDCIPSDSFFGFMEILLETYADDERIGHIGGYNTQNGIQRGLASYYYSRYYHVWGWGTWRRAWKGYSSSIEDYPDFLRDDVLTRIFPQRQIGRFWKNNFDQVYTGKLDTWDYQWVYKNLKEGRLAIIPNVNLVRNIGFNDKATHTKGLNEAISSNEALQMDLNMFSHPLFILPDVAADIYTYEEHCGLSLREKHDNNIIRRSVKKIRPLLILIGGHLGIQKAEDSIV